MRRSAIACMAVLFVAALTAPIFAQPNTGNPQFLWWGMATEPENDRGLLVIGITSGSPAEKARLAIGDYITNINGTDVKSESRGANAHIAHMQTNQPNQNFRITYSRNDREQTTTITSEIMNRENTETTVWFQNQFRPLFNQFREAMDEGDHARMGQIRDQLTPIVRAKARDAQNALRRPDEFVLDWICVLGFLGDRRGVERIFDDVMNPRLRRGETAPTRIYTKMHVCWALIALADADTKVAIIKDLTSKGDHPLLSRSGAQLICAIFEALAAEGRRGETKTKRLQKDLADNKVHEDLGNLFINQGEELKRYSHVLKQWRDMGSPRNLSPQDAQAVGVSQFYVGRAAAHARALAWIPERLSISYLTRARDISELTAIASASIERLFPGYGHITFDWYRDNSQFMHYDDSARVWKFSEEAKAAGMSAEEYFKQNRR